MHILRFAGLIPSAYARNVISCVAATLTACGDPPSDTAPLTVAVWSDSVRLDDRDSSAIGTPSGLTRMADGRFVVADFGTKQLRVFAADGRSLAILGARGRGPGEFIAPSALDPVSDDVVALLDVGTMRVSAVDLTTGATVRSARLLAQGLDVRAAHSAVYVAVPSVFLNRAFASWDRLADTTVSLGVMPALYTQYPRLKRNLGLSVLAPSADGLWVGVLGSNAVAFHPLSALDTSTRSVEIPRRVRRGVPLDRPDWLQREMPYEEEVQSVSLLTSLAVLSDGRIAAVHQDLTIEATSVSLQAFLSVVDPTSGQGCIDLAIPVVSDEMPVLRLIGDRLYALRLRTAGDDVSAWVYSVDLARLRCR